MRFDRSPVLSNLSDARAEVLTVLDSMSPEETEKQAESLGRALAKICGAYRAESARLDGAE